MSRTPAKFRQPDIARALRAAPDGWRVRLTTAGDIIIEKDQAINDAPTEPLDERVEFTL